MTAYRWEIIKETKDYERGVYTYEAKLVPTMSIGEIWAKVSRSRKDKKQCERTGSPDTSTASHVH